MVMTKKNRKEAEQQAREKTSTAAPTADYPWERKVTKALKKRTRSDADTIRRAMIHMEAAMIDAFRTYEDMPKEFKDNYESIVAERHSVETLRALCQ